VKLEMDPRPGESKEQHIGRMVRFFKGLDRLASTEDFRLLVEILEDTLQTADTTLRRTESVDTIRRTQGIAQMLEEIFQTIADARRLAELFEAKLRK